MKTPFYDIHRSPGAKIVDFHGWEMPVQYTGTPDFVLDSAPDDYDSFWKQWFR